MNDFDATIPIYLQIMNDIKRDIVTGRLGQGAKLPSVRECAEANTVNPNTVQRAYQELEREGVSETRRGMGTFVRDDPELTKRLRQDMARSTTLACLSALTSLGFTNSEILAEIQSALTEESL
ncbi:MAG: GntR family transcriptional regulator [Spirochaetales bacterium]|nr:GntR family transcriptional regulator [Spirochaetales bacterium]HNQ97353.1 GntR family transcriptional regulator [Treponemataceae bacterium]